MDNDADLDIDAVWNNHYDKAVEWLEEVIKPLVTQYMAGVPEECKDAVLAAFADNFPTS
jgi:hypothetical protein